MDNDSKSKTLLNQKSPKGQLDRNMKQSPSNKKGSGSRTRRSSTDYYATESSEGEL